jgi:hypothetical protein
MKYSADVILFVNLGEHCGWINSFHFCVRHRTMYISASFNCEWLWVNKKNIERTMFEDHKRNEFSENLKLDAYALFMVLVLP